MRRRINRLALALLLVSLPAAAAGPDIVLRDFTGRPRNVNEFIGHGKWLVVVVWLADCPICKRDIHHMTFFHDEHGKKDAAVLGVSVDGYANREKALGFVADHALNFPNLIGDRGDASRFGGGPFIGTPTYYIFSPEGKYMTGRVGGQTQEQVEQIIRALKKHHEGISKKR